MITGASGYIGSCLTSLAIKRGHEVIAASRQNTKSHHTPWIYFNLSSKDTIAIPAFTNVVIHLAANTSATNLLNDDVEVAAARKLLKATNEVGAKFIFISSQTARANAPTAYGKIKWQIEQEVLASGGKVIRPGLVYGRQLNGLYGRLVRIVQKLPLLPIFIPSPFLQPIHIDDLVDGILFIAENDDTVGSNIYCLASPLPISFSAFLRAIAKERLRCTRFFFPIPVFIINLIFLLKIYSRETKFTFDRLQSLFNLPIMTVEASLDQIGLRPRSLDSGLHPSGNNRQRKLLQEGNAFLGYIMKRPPNKDVLRRYVRVINSLRKNQEFALPKIFLSYPILISLLDSHTRRFSIMGEEFNWRLDAATVLAEATPEGATRFLGATHRYRLSTDLFLIINALASEAFWHIARIIFTPFLYFYFAHRNDSL